MWAEGPSAIELGGEWVVYFEAYQEGYYGMLRSFDLVTWVRNAAPEFAQTAPHIPALVAAGSNPGVRARLACAVHTQLHGWLHTNRRRM